MRRAMKRVTIGTMKEDTITITRKETKVQGRARIRAREEQRQLVAGPSGLLGREQITMRAARRMLKRGQRAAMHGLPCQQLRSMRRGRFKEMRRATPLQPTRRHSR